MSNPYPDDAEMCAAYKAAHDSLLLSFAPRISELTKFSSTEIDWLAFADVVGTVVMRKADVVGTVAVLNAVVDKYHAALAATAPYETKIASLIQNS
jgi:hypothetical protein